MRDKPQFKVRIKGRTFIIFVHSQSGAAFGKFQHTTEKKKTVFPLLGALVGTNVKLITLTNYIN